MVKKTTKLRWRRRFKRSQHQVENFSVQAEHGLERYFFKRFGNLVTVRRFVVGWVALMVLLATGLTMQTRALSSYYQTIQPAAGGIYTEGVLGSFTTANPIYATSSVDSSVSRLLFAGLFKQNGKNELVNDLAQELKSDKRYVVHTVTLRDNITWHDGKPITAEDVVFTYQTIQNPDAKSPLRANWSKVKIEKIDSRTVKFTLPSPLSSFPQLLTNGILPRHLLDGVKPAQLRTVSFNTTNPVGSGPFKWDSIQVIGQTPETREEQIGLSAYDNYHDNKPDLDSFIIKAINSKVSLINQFNSQEIDAVVGLDKKPEEIPQDLRLGEYEIPVNGQVMIFLKSSNDVLKDKTVRQALTQATNRDEIIRGLGYAVIPANGPLLISHLGYSPKITQLGFNVKKANELLEKNGWKKDKNGIRKKGNLPLQFQLYSQKNTDYALITQTIQRQWKELGADVTVVLQDDTDVQSTIALHSYDALLYGITTGSDPDVFAYWHSSQADLRASNRLNLSELKSSKADLALESGRTRSEKSLREAKYKPFLEAWRDEAPAIALYQPRFYYLTRSKLYGLNIRVVNTAADRYANVQHWRVKTDKVTIE